MTSMGLCQSTLAVPTTPSPVMHAKQKPLDELTLRSGGSRNYSC